MVKKSRITALCGSLAFAGTLFSLSACGDDVTKVTNVTNEVSGMEVAASVEDFADCDSSSIGKMMLASDENAAYVCADSGWVSLSQKASDGKDDVDGNGCSLSDNGDGTLVQICGDDSTTFHIALCGDVPYKTDSEFCYENTVYAKCGTEIYSVGKDVCLDKKVYRNKALAWKNMNPDIDYEVFTDSRDGQAYRSVKIGEQTWMAENLNFDYSAGNGSSCYGMLDEYCDRFGRAYAWSSAMDSAAVYGKTGMGCGNAVECEASEVVRGVCPEGFHLPDTAEWNLLLEFIREDLQDESDLKVVQAIASRDFSGTDDYGFGVLLAGVNQFVPFYGYESYSGFYTSTQYKDDDESSLVFMVSYGKNSAEIRVESSDRIEQFPVRCVKDR